MSTSLSNYGGSDGYKFYKGTSSPIPNQVIVNSDNVTEGSTNLYFTTARARSSISAGGALTYNSTTGEVSYTPPTILTDINISHSDDSTLGSAKSIKTYVDSQIQANDHLSELSGTLDDITTGTTNVHFTATDETKLDGIEASATADQTGAEIKSLYEAESDTNAFTDADHTKLDGIATGAIANVSEDTTPQLGGDLDVNGQDIVSTSNADIEIAPNGTGKTVFKGNTNAGKITLNCENNSHGVSLASPAHADYSGSWTLTLPTSAGSAGQVLTTNGSGVASWSAGSSVSDLNDLSDVNAGSPSDGQVLKWNNSASEWQAAADNNSGGGGGGGSVGGSTGELQFNNGGSFGGDSNLYWDSSAEGLGIGGVTDFSSSGANAKLAINAGFINVDDDYGLVFGGGTSRPAIQGSKADGEIYITNANLGIGTSVPSEKLSVSSGNILIDNNQSYRSKNTSGITRSLLTLYSDNKLYVQSPSEIKFQTNQDASTVNAMTIDSSGKLGVGGSPTGIVSLQGDFGTTETAGLYIQNTGTAAADDVSPIAFTTRSTSWGTQHAATIAAGNSSTSAGGAYLTFKTSTTGQYDPTERMRIDSNGCGIGTEEPSAPLHVTGATTAGDSLSQFTQTGTGRGISVLRNVSNAARQMVGFAQINADSNEQPAVHIQQADSDAIALGIDTAGDVALSTFCVKGNGAIGLDSEDYGTSGQVLTSGGSDAAATWTTLSDNDTTYTAGTGLSLSSTEFSADIGTSSTQVAAGDHNHDSDYAALSHNHDSDYSAIGHNHDSDYQALDADTAKTDVVQTFTAGQRGEVTVLTDEANIEVDLNDSNNFSLTLGGNRTLDNPDNCTAGQSGVITITQPAGSTYTLVYGSYWRFSGGTAPTLTTTASAVDVLAYYVESATRITATLITDTK